MTGLSLLFKDNLNLFLTIFMIAVLTLLVLNIIYLVVKSKLKKKKEEQNNLTETNKNDGINETENLIDSFDIEEKNKSKNNLNDNNQNGVSIKEMEIYEEKTAENRDIIKKIDYSNIKEEDKKD